MNNARLNLFIKSLELTPQYFSIRGDSMNPFYINNKKVIIIKHTKLRYGDIVIFLKNNSMVFHRVVLIKKNKLLTKGDNNLHFDSWIKMNSIVGQYDGKNDVSYKYFKIIIALVSLIIGNAYTFYLYLSNKFKK